MGRLTNIKGLTDGNPSFPTTEPIPKQLFAVTCATYAKTIGLAFTAFFADATIE